MISPGPDLTQRQRQILIRVVEEYVATGQPVGSRHLVELTGMRVSPATVRNELAELERLGLLTHPHTSAGRVPTDRGYRFYVDRLLERQAPRPATFPLDLTQARSEVESALQATTETLSQVTRLIALVSAPPLQTATVRHVEVLLLQPQVAMVVVIASSGGVTKRVYAFDAPVDPGLANWAGQYLNDQVVGLLARERRSFAVGWPSRACPRPSAPSSTCSRPPSPTPRTTSSACSSAARPGSSTMCATTSSARTAR